MQLFHFEKNVLAFLVLLLVGYWLLRCLCKQCFMERQWS